MQTVTEERYTVRAFVVGVVLSALVVVMSQYSANVLHGSYLSIDHMPAGGIFVFLLLVAVVGLLAKRVSGWFRFSEAELLLVYAMLLVSSSVATMGLGTQLLPMLSGPFYYASLENRWDLLIHPYVHPWFAPRDPEAIVAFYEGLAPGEGIPWGAWLLPLGVWVPFLLTLYFVMICTAVILRGQWVDNERLGFPLTYLPLEMVRRESGKRPLLKNSVMWAGFALPFLIGSLNAFHNYNEQAPKFDLVFSLPIMERLWNLQFRMSFPIIGFGYFISSKVAFGLWFFNLLANISRVVLIKTGIESPENLGPYGAWSTTFKHLGMGALGTLVLYGLWSGRRHLSNVARKALTGATDVDDSKEVLSYRTAFLGWITGVILLAGWLNIGGLPFLIGVAFVVLALLIFVGVLRVVAQGGLPTLIAPSVAPSQIISSVGCQAIGPAGLATLGFTYIWAGDIRTFVMSSAMHSMKLDGELRVRSHRPMFWAIMTAVFIGIVVSSLMVLTLAYEYGGINLEPWYFHGNTRVAYRYIAQKIEFPTEANLLGWTWKGIGAGTMLIIMYLQRNFYWWPIHPLGYAIGANVWTTRLWFSIFLAWAIKGAILKYGGGRFYHSARPFFLGLVLGQYSCAGMWFVIDAITGKVGNVVFWI